MNVHDVTRYLIRAVGHKDGNTERDLLLTVDANEQGFGDLESYKEHLAQQEREKKAQEQVVSSPPQTAADSTAALSDEQLQAELDRRSALAQAQAGGGAIRPGTPGPTS